MIKDLADLYKKYPWVRIDGTEDEEKLAFKSRYIFIYSMTPAERQVFWQKEKVHELEQDLAWAIESRETDKKMVDDAKKNAKYYAQEYEETGSEEAYDKAEFYLGFVNSYKPTTIKDIRGRREKLQWQRAKLKEMLKNLER